MKNGLATRSHLKKRHSALAGVATLATLGLVLIAGCSASDGGKAEAGDKAICGGATDSGGEQLTVSDFGGAWADNWKKFVVKPFEEKYNAKLSSVSALTGDVRAKVRAERNRPNLDVIVAGDTGAALLAEEKLLAPLDPKMVPNLDRLYPLARRQDNRYADFLFASVVLAYNTQKVTSPPQTFSDLADPQYKGKVMIPDIGASVSGAVFLVQEAKANGGGESNIDPGFAAISKLKPNIQAYWTSEAQVINALDSGQVSVAVWQSDRAAVQMKAGAPVGVVFPKSGAIYGNGIGIVEGTQHPCLAAKYVDFALSKEVQSKFHAATVLAPSNMDATLPEDVKKFVPSPELIQKAGAMDWTTIAKNLAEWTDRWNREVTS